MSYIRTLRGFRPKIEKLGNVLSVNAMRTMEQAKLDAAAVSATVSPEETEAIFAKQTKSRAPSPAADDDDSTAHTAGPSVKPQRDKPRISKKARKQGRHLVLPCFASIFEWYCMMLYDAVFCAVGILQFRKSVQNTGGFFHMLCHTYQGQGGAVHDDGDFDVKVYGDSKREAESHLAWSGLKRMRLKNLVRGTSWGTTIKMGV